MIVLTDNTLKSIYIQVYSGFNKKKNHWIRKMILSRDILLEFKSVFNFLIIKKIYLFITVFFITFLIYPNYFEKVPTWNFFTFNSQSTN